LSGSTLHDGLDYQAWVTVLAAVEFLVIQDSATQLIVEPPSHEDIEGDIHRALGADEPTPSENQALAAAAEPYTLVIQSKRRDDGVWTVSGVETLLHHGGDLGTRRPSAKNRLIADLKIRYLLATSGHLVDRAAKLRVQRFGEWPDLAEVDPRFQTYFAGDQCRVGVIDSLTEAGIRDRLARLCKDALLMPFDRIEACLDALFAAAHVRGRSDHCGVWSKAEVEEILQRHDALLPGRIDREDYVEPQNFDQIQATLTAQQAVLIVGPSGTGKTRTAERLRDQLRADLKGPRLMRLGSSDGPGALSDALQASPVIVYLDDPWGPVVLADHAGGWTKALQAVSEHRRRGTWLIITSRSDVYSDAKIPDDAFAPWKVTLDASAYGPAERRQLLARMLKTLPLRLRGVIEPHIERAVDDLTTPLEIRTFVAGAARAISDEGDAGDVVGASLRRAKGAQYKDVVSAQIIERDDAEAATILWLLFKAEASLSLDEMARARRAVNRLPGTTIQVESLVHFLRAGQSLDQADDRYSYAHPQVEAGLKAAAFDDPAVFEAAGARLIEAFASQSGEGFVGPLIAARMLAGAVSSDPTAVEGLVDTVSRAARDAIDAKLLAALRALDGSPFEVAFRTAAKVGSAGILAFDLARWFLEPLPLPPEPDLGDLSRRWLGAPAQPGWKAAIAADPGIRDILAKAVVNVIGDERDFHPDNFGDRLAALGVDLTDAFGALALRLVGHSYDPLVYVAINGALRTPSSLEPAVRLAQTIFDGYVEEVREGWKLDLINGVFDDEYADYLGTSDDGNWAAGEIAKAWVRAKRQGDGWRSLAAFPDVGLLGWSWAEDIEAGTAPLDRDEFDSLLTAVRGGTREKAAWKLAAHRTETSLIPVMKKRLGEPGVDAPVRGIVRRVWAIHDLEGLADAQSQYVAAARTEQVLALHRDLVPLQEYFWPRDALAAARMALASRLPAPLDELARAISADLDNVLAQPGPVADAAAAVTTDNPEIAARLLKLTDGQHPAFDHLYILAMDGWSPDNTAPADAALTVALHLGRTDLVRAALHHPIGNIVRRAIEAVGDTTPTAALVALPGLKGSIVRKAVIARLGERPADENASAALLDLTKDTYNSGHSGDPHHSLAREAAAHLAARDVLSPALLNAVQGSVLALQDAGVRRPLLRRLGQQSAGYRQWLWGLVVDEERPLGIRRDAALALFHNAKFVEPGIVDQITLDRLLNLPGSVAVLLTLIVTRRSEVDQLKQLATRLNDSADRRGLIVLLRRPSTPEINNHLLSLLGEDHPAASLIDDSGGLAPWTALDELAELSIVQTIRQLLKGRFEPEPRPIWPAWPPKPSRQTP
jgi:hypothetical protein